MEIRRTTHIKNNIQYYNIEIRSFIFWYREFTSINEQKTNKKYWELKRCRNVVSY